MSAFWSRRAVLSVGALSALAALLSACTVLEPRSAREGEIEAIEAQIAKLSRAVDRNDYETLVDITFPPRMLNGLAAEAGFMRPNFRAFLIETLEEAGDSELVELESYEITFPENPEFRDIIDPTILGDESLLTWTLLRSRTDVRLVLDDDDEAEDDGFAIRQISNVAAIKDNGRWYLIAVSDESDIALLEPYYPFIEWQGVPESEVDFVFNKKTKSLIRRAFEIAKAAGERGTN